MIKARFSGPSLTVRASATCVAHTLLIYLEHIVVRPHGARGALQFGPTALVGQMRKRHSTGQLLLIVA